MDVNFVFLCDYYYLYIFIYVRDFKSSNHSSYEGCLNLLKYDGFRKLVTSKSRIILDLFIQLLICNVISLLYVIHIN